MVLGTYEEPSIELEPARQSTQKKKKDDKIENKNKTEKRKLAVTFTWLQPTNEKNR
jgi:hypothetical protein